MGHRRKNKSEKSFTGPIVAATTVGVGAVGLYTGVVSELLDPQIVPRPPTYPDAVEGMVSVNEAIRTSAPVVGLSMVALGAYYKMAGRFDRKKRTLNQLSVIDYSGTEDVMAKNETHRFSKTVKRLGSVAAVSATLIMATSGLEKDVSGGSLRPIEAITNVVADGDDALQFVVQSEKNTFMDDSTIPAENMTKLVSNADARGISVIPFYKELMNVDASSAIELSLPDPLFAQLTGIETDDSCKTIPTVIDSTVGKSVGDTISINDRTAQVVRVEDNLAQMNRSVAIVSESDMKTCLKSDTDNAYFGALIPGATDEQIGALFSESDIDGMTAVERKAFFENNKDFWRANGTPLILILMGSIAVLGGVASAKERRSALQRNAREIGMLQASGVSMKDIRSIETRRALWESMYASATGAVVSPIVAAGFNASVTGLQVGVGPREMMVGGALTWLSTTVAARKAVSSVSSNMNLSQAVKG